MAAHWPRVSSLHTRATAGAGACHRARGISSTRGASATPSVETETTVTADATTCRVSNRALHSTITVTAVNDYRTLQPRLVTDPNGNRSEVVFDALGMVVGTALMGSAGRLGDTLVGFDVDLDADTSGAPG